MLAEQKRPEAFTGANVEGADRAPRTGDDRPAGGTRGPVESTMSMPKARQVPVEGAVTGPEAPPAEVDEVYERADLDRLQRLDRPRA